MDRAIHILGAFSQSRPVLTLAELARETGLYKSTLLRLIASLVNGHYLKQRGDGSYQIGPASLHLAAIYQRSMQPVELIQPLLRQMVAATGESASFNVREGNMRVCLYRENSPNPIRDSVRVGDCVELERGAGGKVLLAFSGEPGAVYDEIRGEVAFTTIGERFPDTAAIACPVFRIGEKLAGALTLSGPKTRFSAAAIENMRLVLLDAAAELTHSLGGNNALQVNRKKILARNPEIAAAD